MEISEVTTIDDIQTLVEERAGVSLDNGTVPVGYKFAWFENKVFELRAPLPLGKAPLAIFAMFQDPDEVRIYAVLAPPKGWKPPKDKDGKEAPVPPAFQRFTLSKHSAHVFVDVFPGTTEDPKLGLECFINLIVDELKELEGTSFDAADLLAEARALIAEGKTDEALELLKEDEEDEEDKEEAKDKSSEGSANGAEDNDAAPSAPSL